MGALSGPVASPAAAVGLPSRWPELPLRTHTVSVLAVSNLCASIVSRRNTISQWENGHGIRLASVPYAALRLCPEPFDYAQDKRVEG